MFTPQLLSILSAYYQINIKLLAGSAPAQIVKGPRQFGVDFLEFLFHFEPL